MKGIFMAGALALLVMGCGGGGGGGSPGPSTPVASVTVAPATVTLTRGESAQLTATARDARGTVLDGKTFGWTSEDASRVEVSTTGRVTALRAGTAKVRAVTEGKETTATITVVDPPASVERVTLNIVSERLEEGEALQLVATVYDADGGVLTDRAVRFESSDAGIVNVDTAGVATALRPGIVTVMAAVEGRAASATIRAFAEYPFGLVYGSGAVGEFDELYSLDINDPNGSAVPVFGPGKRASHAVPSPDGTRIAFAVHGNWDGTYWQSMIYAADRDGSNAQRLTTLPARSTEPAWSPDGSRIAFSSQVYGENSEVWVMNADGSNLVNLTADQPFASKRSPTWSPVPIGGAYRIAYALETGGASFLWSMAANGADKHAITDDARYFDSEPAWSPDGTVLVFQRTGDGIFGDLYIVGRYGGAVRALMPSYALPYGQFSPTWSPDGRLVAFLSKHADGENYQIWTVWADGTRLAQRTHDLVRHTDPAWIRTF